MTDPRGPARQRAQGEPIEAVLIHPPFDKPFTAHEHPEGELNWLGDALGVDLVVVRFVDGWMRAYKGDGRANEDWYGWNAPVLAPFDGWVRHVTEPGPTNQPGSHSGGKSGGIIFERADGVFVCYGHLHSIEVSVGQRVRAGDVVGRLGNNGFSWHPHLHVGAWRGDTPLQVRFDLAVRGRQRREQGESVYYGID